MESLEFLMLATVFLLKVLAGIGMIVFVSFLGTLIYDEITGRSNDLYEYALTAAVGAEFVLNGKPKKPHNPDVAIGRHRRGINSNEVFVSELLQELRQNPSSLCYIHRGDEGRRTSAFPELAVANA
jgi:hypothetical protein